MFIPILLGTGREGRLSELAAKFVLERVKALEVESEVVDPREYLDHTYTERVGKEKKEPSHWAEIMSRADGLIVVTPEYNHGYPGELKLMLDMLYGQYGGKAVVACGVSSGGLGGARVVEQLIPVFVALQMVPIKKSVYFPNAGELFDEQGNITDPAYTDRVNAMLSSLLECAHKLTGLTPHDEY